PSDCHRSSGCSARLRAVNTRRREASAPSIHAASASTAVTLAPAAALHPVEVLPPTPGPSGGVDPPPPPPPPAALPSPPRLPVSPEGSVWSDSAVAMSSQATSTKLGFTAEGTA